MLHLSLLIRLMLLRRPAAAAEVAGRTDNSSGLGVDDDD